MAPPTETPVDPAQLAQAGRILGLDVGDRRIGLAVAIPPGTLILPAGHLIRRNLPSDVAAILDQAGRRHAVAIVIGIPYNARGQPGPQARKTASLARALQRATSIPILPVDESYTTRAAASGLRQAGRQPDRERGAVDAAAAAAILRRFLTP